MARILDILTSQESEKVLTDNPFLTIHDLTDEIQEMNFRLLQQIADTLNVTAPGFVKIIENRAEKQQLSIY